MYDINQNAKIRGRCYENYVILGNFNSLNCNKEAPDMVNIPVTEQSQKCATLLGQTVAYHDSQ